MPRDTDPPLRIRFEHTRFLHWGGRSGYVQFVRFLDPKRYRTVLHGASDSHEDLPRCFGPFKPLLRRFIRRGNMPWYKLSDLNAELEAFFACLMRRADIVHFLDGEHSAQFLPRLLRLARLSSVRVVATFHQPPGIIKDIVNPSLLRQLDEIVLVSPSQLSYFSQHVEPDRLQVILHGVDIEFFHPRPAPRKVDRLRCITVGHWLRDWHVFREVASRMRDVTFDVVTGRQTGLEELPNVRTHRGIEDIQLAELYRDADVLYLPLLESTANNGLLEGIASGLPVVCTDLEAVRAYLPNGAGMLVACNSVQGFVDALRKLQSDVGLRAEMGRSARVRAEELAWPNLVGQYEALYRRASFRPSVRVF